VKRTGSLWQATGYFSPGNPLSAWGCTRAEALDNLVDRVRQAEEQSR